MNTYKSRYYIEHKYETYGKIQETRVSHSI